MPVYTRQITFRLAFIWNAFLMHTDDFVLYGTVGNPSKF